jgi:oligopeptide/dipeptide ABC transporter ATP-binding protein
MSTETLLSIRDLTIEFPTESGHRRTAVEGLSLEVGGGERVALVGESGSGKSVAALACLGLIHPPGVVTGGTVEVAGVDVFSAAGEELRSVRGGTVGMVFQEPTSALNPVYTVGFQIAETIRSHRAVKSSQAAAAETRRLLDAVALDDVEAIERAYPHQLSGGQVQRVMIALALAGDPRLLIADEPTTALDLITQAGILELLGELSGSDRASLLLISHDLAIVSNLADRVLVMYAGRVVEEGRATDLFAAPLHPYTRMLLALTSHRVSAADARLSDRATKSGEKSGPGAERRSTSAPPSHPVTTGCRYAPRCPLVIASCRELEPGLEPAGADRRCRCPITIRAEACHG